MAADRKLYVIGDRVAGLLKSGGVGRRTGEPFEPGPALTALARRTGRALGLEIFGVDVIAGERGPAIVDVNAFPSCNGVHGAAEAIAEHLLVAAGGAAGSVGGEPPSAVSRRGRCR